MVGVGFFFKDLWCEGQEVVYFFCFIFFTGIDCCYLFFFREVVVVNERDFFFFDWDFELLDQDDSGVFF